MLSWSCSDICGVLDEAEALLRDTAKQLRLPVKVPPFSKHSALSTAHSSGALSSLKKRAAIYNCSLLFIITPCYFCNLQTVNLSERLSLLQSTESQD